MSESSTSFMRLQWGHALPGVETLRAKQSGCAPSMLQWGHALPGVETPATIAKHFWVLQLQWGHALPGVETTILHQIGGERVLASMGPRPSRRGDVTDTVEPAIVAVLQWGHALPGVETRRRCRTCRCSSSFNGATPFQAWRHERPHHPLRRLRLASMGPRPSRRGDDVTKWGRTIDTLLQ